MAKLGNWFENAANVLAKVANISTDGTTFTGNLTGTETTYTADGAIAVTDKVALLNSLTATTDMTLGAGTVIGQEIVIVGYVVVSSCTVTISNPISSNADVLTFSNSDAAILRWTSQGWAVIQGITIA